MVFEGARILGAAEIKCCDFEETLANVGKGDAVYADPPYTTKGQNNGFRRYNERLFAWEDEERLAEACVRASNKGAFAVVSGMWNKDLFCLFKGWWAAKVGRVSTVSRTPEGRREVDEAVFFSDKPTKIHGDWCEAHVKLIRRI
jgi:DNA adenine methylase